MTKLRRLSAMLVVSMLGALGAQAAEPVRIATIQPLSGAFALQGEEFTKQLRAAADRINANGGIYDGRMIEIVPLDGKRPRQHEILLGIIGDDGTVGAPGDLVAAAEQHQRMDIIDRWVIQHSLQWLRARAEPDGQAGLISINISANALCSDPFLGFLLAELDEGGFHHPHLRFEVTEATAAANLAQTVHFCDSVRSRGCQVALDEFGSRPSSLRILRYLPLDAIKIDGRAIAAMEHGRYHHAALAAIVAAARFLDLQTIAKSVECAEVLPVLKALGVDYAQGYGIAKPAPLHEAPPGDDDE